MAIEVSFCSEPDFRIFAIISDAFASDQPYMDTMYPNHHTAHGRSEGAERLLHMKHTDATNRFLKATDTGTGEIIGYAKWNVFENGMPEQTKLAGSYWESQDEKEYAEFLFEVCLEPIRRVARSAEGALIGLLVIFCLFFPSVYSCADSFPIGRALSADWHSCFHVVLDILTVDPKHQCRGAGRMLVEWGLKMADEWEQR